MTESEIDGPPRPQTHHLGPRRAAPEGRVRPGFQGVRGRRGAAGPLRLSRPARSPRTGRGDREGLRWADVDLSAGLVRLADSKTGAQTRVIGQAAIRLLEAAKPEAVEELAPVCPGTRPGRPFIGIDKIRVRIYQAAGLAGLPGVDLHSLRHTFASVGAHVHNGRYAAFVSALLGHGYAKKAITERYIHANPEALINVIQNSS